MSEQKQFKTTIGGQALMEGIMMRGPERTVAVVRAPEGLVYKESDTKLLKDRYPIAGVPVIRGAIALVSSLKMGMEYLTWSAEYYPEEETDKPSKLDLWLEKHSKGAEKVVMGVAMVLAVILAVGLFTVLPTFLGGLLEPVLGSGFLRNLCETLLRVALLIGYMALVSRMKDIKRTFMYHGAEHKSIACYEAGEALTVENVRRHSRFHPRCGTSFLLTAVLTSLIVFLLMSSVFTFLDWNNNLLRVGVRLLMLPLVVGVSYEINRYAGAHDNVFSRILRAPGLWLQRLTTVEPDDGMIEVGIEALTRVIPAQRGKDAW